MVLARILVSAFSTLIAWFLGSFLIYFVYGICVPREFEDLLIWYRISTPAADVVALTISRPAVLWSALAMAGAIIVYQILLGHVLYALMEQSEREAAAKAAARG